MDSQFGENILCMLNNFEMGGEQMMRRTLSLEEFRTDHDGYIDTSPVCWLDKLDIEPVNSQNCDEIETPISNAQDQECEIEKNQEDVSPIYFSAGIYLPSLPFNGSYENVIELIDVNPDQKMESSPSHDNDDSTSNHGDTADDNYDIGFGTVIHPIEGNNITLPAAPIRNELQCLKLICNPENVNVSSLPEYIDVNEFIPRDLKRRLKKSEETDDDDVIFVKEYKMVPLIDLESQNLESDEERNVTDASVPTMRRRRRRKPYGEKRKNPIRRAQITKASLDLVEKLAIPSSVFNARVKGKKNKIEPKNLRQSCRTSGAIHCPPSPLTKEDFREWPVKGMHERPFYDTATCTIRQFDIASTTGRLKKGKCKDKRPVSPSKSVEEKWKKSKRGDNEKFVQLALERAKMMFDYSRELQKFNQMMNDRDKHDRKKLTLYERNLEFRLQQNGVVKEMEEKKTGGNKANIGSMLEDTCLLFSLASGARDEDFIDLISSIKSS